MPEQRTYQGFTYQRSGPGQPWQRVGAASATPGVQMLGAPDPYKAKTDQRADESLNIDRARLGISQAAEARQAATLPYDIEKSKAEAIKAKAEADALANSSSPVQSVMERLSHDDVITAINQARAAIKSGHSTGIAGQLLHNLGGTNAADLEGTLDTIKANLTFDNLKALKDQSKTGASGLGQLSNKEGDLLASTVASLKQKQSPEKLLDSLDKIEMHYRRFNALLDGKDPSNSDVQKAYGLIPAVPPVIGGPRSDAGTPPGNGGGPGSPPGGVPKLNPIAPPSGPELTTGDTQADPVALAIGAHVNEMMKAGAPDDQIKAYVQSTGGSSSDLDKALQLSQIHPEYRGDYQIIPNQIPLKGLDWYRNAAAQTPIGGYLSGSADTLSMGTIDNLTSNPALTRAGMAALAEKNPTSSLLGQLAGGALLSATGEGALGAAGLPGGVGRTLLTDATIGGGYGAGSNDDGSRLAGGVLGAVGGAGGGYLGGKAANVAGGLIGGVGNELIRGANDRGIRMTPGQLFSQSGIPGGIVKNLEDGASGMPFIGPIINARRAESLRDANVAAFNEGPMVSPITDVGTGGMVQKKGDVSALYNRALNGKQFTPDIQIALDRQNIVGRGENIPVVGPMFKHVIDNNIDPILQNASPTLSGENLQAIIRTLRNRKATFGKMAESGTNPMGSDAATEFGNLDRAFQDFATRQDPSVIPALNEANQAHANRMVLRDAVLAAKNQPDNLFTGAQLNAASVKNTSNFGGKDAASEGQRPFFELGNIMQNVLPSKIGDSGTGNRVALLATLGALGGGAGGGAGYATGDGAGEGAGLGTAAGLLSGLGLLGVYSRGGSALTRSILSRRPNAFRDLGDFVASLKLPYGGLALPGSVPYALSYQPGGGN